MIKNIQKLTSLKSKDKILLVKVVTLTAIARFSMLKIPFKELKKHMGKVNVESSFKLDESDYDLRYVINDLKRFKWVIQAVSKRTPWESKCLVQALTAQYLTNKKGITSTLYLGVKRDSDNNLIAHSWIRCGDFYITGGNGEGYAITAKFTKYGDKSYPVG